MPNLIDSVNLIKFANVMFKMRIFVFLMTFFIVKSFAQTKKTIEYFTYNENVLQQDIAILKEVLLNIHPSIDFYAAKEWYKNYFDTALIVHQPMTEKIFRMFLKRKLSVLRCGHTVILPSKKYDRYLNKKSFIILPYFMGYFEPYLINVKNIDSKDTLLKAMDTIVSINHKPVSDYAKEFEDYLYVDAFAVASKRELIQKNFIFYYSAIYENDSALIEQVKYNKHISKKIPFKKFKHLNNILWQMKSDTLMKKYGGRYYAGVYLDTNKVIYYMKIKSFSGMSMRHFFKKTFRQLQKNNSQVLILDLRNNPGGKIAQSLNLLSYLLPQKDSIMYETRIQNIKHKKYISRKLEFRIIQFFMQISKKHRDKKYVDYIRVNSKYHFNNKIYVLVNANTFSAANLVAVYLSKRPNTKIIGTETSGALWGSNAVNFLRLTLPNTKIKCIIPTFRIYHSMKNDNQNHLLYSILPDIYVHYNPSDYLNKKDKALEGVYFDLMRK